MNTLVAVHEVFTVKYTNIFLQWKERKKLSHFKEGIVGKGGGAIDSNLGDLVIFEDYTKERE